MKSTCPAGPCVTDDGCRSASHFFTNYCNILIKFAFFTVSPCIEKKFLLAWLVQRKEIT